MWKYLYLMAAPRNFFHILNPKLPFLLVLALLFLFPGLIWGLFYAPPDYQQGDAFRIIYVHVPAAFLSMALYVAMAFCAVLLLVWRIKLAGLMQVVLAEVGASMALIALITGSIWGKPMWGTWWVWDARLTSELILLLLYIVILVVNASFKNREQSDKMLAILTLVGFIDLPIIHYSVYWWNTLHQGSTLSFFSKPKIASSMLYPLLLTVFGFVIYALWLVFSKACNEILRRENKQNWLLKLYREGRL